VPSASEPSPQPHQLPPIHLRGAEATVCDAPFSLGRYAGGSHREPGQAPGFFFLVYVVGRSSTSEERLPSRGGACSRRWCLGKLQFRIRHLRLILRRLRNCRFRIGRFGLVARLRRHCIPGHEHLPETSSTHLMRDRHRLLRKQQIGSVKGSR
jgi:hypothetical protein